VTWEDELQVILEVAARAGLDWALLAALRKAENGGPQRPNPEASGNPYVGGEFGVQTVGAPTFEEQARVAANSLRAHLRRFPENPFAGTTGIRLGYSVTFVRDFSQRWAPPAAHRLNAQHAENLWALYCGFAAQDL
jgi:hypothetical protein